MLDFAVNVGAHPAVCCLQRALGVCDSGVAVDGLIGPATIAATKALVDTGSGEFAIMVELRHECAAFYRRIAAAKGQSARKYLHGWLARAYA